MGEVFAGRYELLDVIGEGGMGSVWRVWDARSEQVVAAKVLRQSDAVSLLRFVREQAVRVRHPHVLTPIGWAGEDDRVLFTMPVVDGGSVATLVGDHGPLPPLLVAELLRQLLSALGSVHAGGIVHRDVKPGNLLLVATGTQRPHLLLTDFGIAVDEQVPRFTRTGGVTGTPGYIAPEAELGDDVAPAIDVYAVGQVGRAMLTGVRPTDPGGQDRPAGVPDALWHALTAMSSAHPADRPSTAAALTLLSDPVLAWHEGAMGEVEVLRQLDDGNGRPQLGVSATDDLPTRAGAHLAPRTLPPAGPLPRTPTGSPRPTPEASAPRGPENRPPASGEPGDPEEAGGAGGRRRSAVAAVALAAVLAGIGSWAWAGRDQGGPAVRPPATTVTAGSPSPTPSTSPSGSSTASTGSPPASATPTRSRSSGTVQVGPVIVRVGQPCTFSDVGLRDETIDGDPVVCARRSDGTYAWDAPRR